MIKNIFFKLLEKTKQLNFLKKIVNIFRKIVSWFLKSSWKKKAVVIVVILIIGFFVGRKFFINGDDGYLFGTAQKRTITEIVSESGLITTSGSANIYSPTNGVVEEVFVSNDEEVNERQKLFTVKSTATSQEKTAAFAAYKAAATALQQAENNLRDKTATRDKVLDDVKGHDDDESFEQKQARTTAEVAADNAYEAVLAARAQLTAAQVAYQATQNATVIAPVSGLISNLSVISGSSVLVNNILAPSSPALMISGLGITEVMISVSENDINKIKVGQEVTIKVDAIDDKAYKGMVTRVDKIGTITQGVVSFNVYMEIVDPDDKIKSNMTIDVDIITNELEGVLSVPNTAVKPYQKGRAVRSLGSNDEIEFIPVKIGLKGKEFTQITEGLEERQKIIVSLTNVKVERTSPFGF